MSNSRPRSNSSNPTSHYRATGHALPSAAGRFDGKHPSFAADLVRLGMDVILTFGGPATAAATKATATIPIVFLLLADPVAIGVAASLERPGSNATGITNHDPDQARMQFALLKEVFPDLARVAILSDADIPGADASGLAPIERVNAEAARALGIQPNVFKVRRPNPDLSGCSEPCKKTAGKPCWY